MMLEHDSNNNHEEKKPTSRLLTLPPELQLLIFEFAVISVEPLYINCPCDSSYGGWTEKYHEDRSLWETGVKHPPWQPGLTRTCTSIRADTLQMFYKHNTFQAGYCYECDLEIVFNWLKHIGAENRATIGNFVFFDANRRHDRNTPKDLTKVKRSRVVREMGGKIESSYNVDGCRHAVRFGEHADEELLALERLFKEDVEPGSDATELYPPRRLTEASISSSLGFSMAALSEQFSDCDLFD